MVIITVSDSVITLLLCYHGTVSGYCSDELFDIITIMFSLFCNIHFLNLFCVLRFFLCLFNFHLEISLQSVVK